MKYTKMLTPNNAAYGAVTDIILLDVQRRRNKKGRQQCIPKEKVGIQEAS
jgi:hypothetical protein